MATTTLRLAVITTVRQVDGDVRYLLCDAADAAGQRAVVRNTGLVDACDPDYIVDRDPDGHLTCARYPGSDVTPAEWRAIRAAIRR